MPTQISPGGIQYHLIAFDTSGNERTDDPQGKMSEKTLAALREEPVTDVFLMRHGWQGDMPSALRQHNRWIDALAACTVDRAVIAQKRPGFRPLIVGLHWPSLAWDDEELLSENVSFAPGASPVGDLVEKYAERLADTLAAREALQTIIASAVPASRPTISNYSRRPIRTSSTPATSATSKAPNTFAKAAALPVRITTSPSPKSSTRFGARWLS